MEEKHEEKAEKKIGFSFKELKKENFVVILLLGILLLVAAWPISEKETENSKKESVLSDEQSDMVNNEGTVNFSAEVTGQQEWRSYADLMESTLEDVLSTMEGAGKVKVMITLEDSGEAVVEKDITTGLESSTQVNADGGSHNTSGNEKTGETVYVDEKDSSFPYVKQVLCPKIKGVVVSAQGGGNQTVNKNITEAIQALFGIDVHKIKIIKMSSKS